MPSPRPASGYRSSASPRPRPTPPASCSPTTSRTGGASCASCSSSCRPANRRGPGRVRYRAPVSTLPALSCRTSSSAMSSLLRGIVVSWARLTILSASTSSGSSSASVRDEVADAYGLDVTGCRLLRSFVNDVYAIITPGRRYLLKVYRHGYWSPDEVAWELDLTRHLLCSGVPVPDVVPLADGRLAGVIDAPEGQRPYALTAFVESGAKARKPFTAG